MKANVGEKDKVVRIVVALVAAGLYLTGIVAGELGYVLLAVAAIAIITSAVSFCPLYKILGFSSCKKCCEGSCDSEDKSE